MSQPAILILESLAEAEQARASHARMLSDVARLVGVSPQVREVANLTEFRRAGSEFSERGFCLLHVCCHGSPEGMWLADKSLVEWDALFSAFDFKSTLKTHLSFSSCSTMAGDDLVDAALRAHTRPKLIFGFDDDIYAQDVAIAAAHLLRALSTNNHAAVLRCFAAIRLDTGLDIKNRIYIPKRHEYDWITGSRMLRYLVHPGMEPEGAGFREAMLASLGDLGVEELTSR